MPPSSDHAYAFESPFIGRRLDYETRLELQDGVDLELR